MWFVSERRNTRLLGSEAIGGHRMFLYGCIANVTQPVEPRLQRLTVVGTGRRGSSEVAAGDKGITAELALCGVRRRTIRAREFHLPDNSESSEIGARQMLTLVGRTRCFPETADHRPARSRQENVLASECTVADASSMQFGECRAEINEDIEKVDQTEGRLFSKRRGFEVTQPQLASLINFVKPDRLDHSFDASGVEHPGLVAQTRPLSADGVLDQDCVARSIVANGRTSQHMQKL